MGWEGLFRQVLLQYAPSHAAHTGRHPVSSHHSTRPAVYTASGGVYVEDNGGDVDETSPVVARGAGERSDRLLDLEDAVFRQGP